MVPFATRRISEEADVIAPDGSEVRLLAVSERGSMAHFRLPAGATSKPVRHRSVEELWFFTGGKGLMWRRLGEEEGTVAVAVGTSLSIPPGTSFQFRATGDSPLDAVAVTMPPWPGMAEAELAEGIWPATV
ncbi:MAG TPA: cupin domain-containing protein [Bauldia sp.]|nr:cupin domain-containing protein [Bauldia sp.]